MKKILAVILALILVFSVCAVAMAEEVVAPIVEQAPMIDLTQIVTSIIGLIVSFLLAWFIKAVIPPLKKWLEAKTTAEQRTMLYQVVQNLVNAAEQLIGRGKGSEKMKYVIAALEERGFEVDLDMIESAVKEMNDKAMAQALAVLNAKSAEKESDESDPTTEDEDTETEV
ncbi:MAG: phage holin, LLH family [Christensenellales bacterium]|nr:phage holin, LLH family [Christensenellales bacterium]